jgi:hypothetical protein
MTDLDLQLNTKINPDVLAGIEKLSADFSGAEPFRHAVIDNFLTDDFCAQLIAEFPEFDEKLALNEDGFVGAKAVREKIRGIGPAFLSLDELVKSEAFRDLIGKITAIPDLQHDPHYFGGGTHENRQGQGLDPHVDFNYHPITRQHRRLNVIVYLNPEWDTAWGGALQLHRDPYLPPSKDEIKLVNPLANRCVIFETTENSWHGFKRIDLPADKKHLSRKSFALYYYTENRPTAETAPEHSTIYVQEHLPEWYHPGMTLDGDELQNIRVAVASRNQHLKRLYRNIMDLNQQIHDLRYRLDTELMQEALPDVASEGQETFSVDGKDEQEANIRRLTAQLQKSQMHVKELETSTSWRITAPLRALKRTFSKS